MQYAHRLFHSFIFCLSLPLTHLFDSQFNSGLVVCDGLMTSTAVRPCKEKRLHTVDGRMKRQVHKNYSDELKRHQLDSNCVGGWGFSPVHTPPQVKV